MEIYVYFFDNDVFVFVLRWFLELCSNVLFVIGKGCNCREIRLELIVQVFGEVRIVVFFVFYVFSGVDNIGCFLDYGKFLCWKVFLNVDEDVVRQMVKLGIILILFEEIIKVIEKFVCEFYVLNILFIIVKEF